MALAVRADSFDLSLFRPLLPPRPRAPSPGALRWTRTSAGPPTANATGTVQLRDVAVTLPTLDLSYEQGTLAGRFERNHFRVDSLRLNTGKKETLVARGRCTSSRAPTRSST